MRQVAVLGATGSIGASTLDVIARHPQRFRASILAANNNVADLVELSRRHSPDFAVIANESLWSELRDRLSAAGLPTQAIGGAQALVDLAAGEHCDTVVAAIVGAAGLQSTLAAAAAGKRLLLANKEAVVMAGALLKSALVRGGGELLPVDSEHNAIFQCLPGGLSSMASGGVRRIVLTASGGPFRGWRREQLQTVSPDQACAHPNWRMGRKISVDSATLMNKGLEVIEAHCLFDASPENIAVVVHPESIVHSLVEYCDGSTLAQLGNPDMRTALAYALAWPDRVDAGVAPLDLLALAQLRFEPVDDQVFRCLPLAYAALQQGGSAPTVLNAANEIAVGAFLRGELGFLSIAELIERTLDQHANGSVGTLEDVLHADLTARKAAARIMRNLQ